MIAKNKGDFFYNLHNELHRIGIDDDEEIVADFEAHFMESSEAGLSEEETCERLGDIKEIARNYLDIDSTGINSLVAENISGQSKVSLTKPGASMPADISLAHSQPIREVTPQHIMEEPTTPPPSPKVNLFKPREVTPEHIAYEPPPGGEPQNSSQPQTNSQTQSSTGDTRYQYKSCIPKENTERQDNVSHTHEAEIPPQSVPPVGNHAKQGGFKFSDIKGLKPKVNAGKLITCILLDLLLWSWLLPMVIGFLISTFIPGGFGLIAGGFEQLNNGYYHILSRILLCCGTVSAGVLVECALIKLFELVLRWIKFIVISHIKAIYDL